MVVSCPRFLWEERVVPENRHSRRVMDAAVTRARMGGSLTPKSIFFPRLVQGWGEELAFRHVTREKACVFRASCFQALSSKVDSAPSGNEDDTLPCSLEQLFPGELPWKEDCGKTCGGLSGTRSRVSRALGGNVFISLKPLLCQCPEFPGVQNSRSRY